MSIKSTSIMPRVLFLVSVIAVAGVALLLWWAVGQKALAPVQQQVAQFVESMPVLPQSRRAFPEKFLIEIRTQPGQEQSTSDSPSSSPGTSPSSVQMGSNTTIVQQTYNYLATPSPSLPDSPVFTNVTTQNTLTVQGSVTMQQFTDGFLFANGAGELSSSRVSLSSSSQVADRLPTASGGTGNDFSNVGAGALVSFSSTGQMAAINPGTAGYILTSNGSGLPTWAAAPPAVVDWTNPGTIGSDTPNTGEFTQLALTGTTTPLTVGSSEQLKVDDNGRMTITYVGDSGFLSSSGGALFFDNTNNIGTGIGIYSNAGAEAEGNMINVKVDNPLYNQAAFYMNYDGQSNAVEIVSNSTDSSSNALAVTGNNINDSTVGIIGYELGRGTIKVTHNRPGSGNDQNASGLSIDLKGSGTRAQGVYVDSTEVGGTLGNLLRLRNESIDRFVVGPTGNLTLAGNITQGANATNTTYTKVGNVAGDEFFVGTTGAFRVQRSAGNSEAFRTQVSGDTQGRWLGTSDGQLKWGPGNATQDVTLRRGTTGTLFLDGGIFLNNLNQNIDSVIKGLTDNNLFYVDSSADAIGIGTSGPQAALHISKNAGTLPTLLVNQIGTGDLLGLSLNGANQLRVTNGGDLFVGNGTFNNPSSSQDAYVTGNLEVDGTIYGNLSGALTPTGFTQGSVAFAGSGGTLTQDNANLFWDNSTKRLGIGTSSPSKTLFVGSGSTPVLSADITTARVGVGINNPGSIFHVRGNSPTLTIENTQGSSIDRESVIQLKDGTNGNAQIVLGRLSGGTDVGGYLSFYTQQTTGVLSEKMRILAGGNIGIGTTNPGYKLEVNGTGYFGGKLAVNSSSLGSNSLDVYTNSAGTLATFQSDAATNGDTLLNVLLNNATSGSLYGLRISGSTTGNLYSAIQQSGSGNATFYASVSGTGDARSRYAVSGGQNWSVGLDNSDNDSFKISGSDTLGTSDFLTILTGGNVGIGNTNPGSLLTVGTTAPFLVDSSGNITQGVNGANTTFTKNGNTAGDQFFIGTNGAFRAQRSASGSEAFRTQVNGDTQGRWVGTSDGRLSWGPGNAAQDVTLRRTAVGVLTLDGSLIPGTDATYNLGSTALKWANVFTGNAGVGATTFGTSAANVLAIANSTAPTASITDGIQLFAVDVAGSHELQVRDEAGNVTTLSPHNFSLIPEGRSEDLAWAFYSERNGLAINADMTKALRVLEDLSGEKLIHLKNLANGESIETFEPGESLATQLQNNQQVLGAVTENVSFLNSTWSFVKDVVFTAQARFEQAVEFIKEVRFKAGVVFEQAVTFQGRLRVNRDTAGTFVLPAGTTKLKVHFQNSFSQKPMVYVSSPQLFQGKYSLDEVTSEWFVVSFTEPQATNISLQWWAVEAPAGQADVEILEGTVSSPVSPQPVQQPSPSPTAPTPEPQQSSIPTPSPEVTPEPSVSPSPVVEESPTPMPSTSPEATPAPTP